MSASAAESDQMLKDKLDGMVAKWIADGTTFQIWLFQSNTANTPDSVTGDFTQSDFSGYGAHSYDPTDFGAATVTAHVASILAAYINTWTNAGAAQLVYGYIAVDGDSEEYVFGETFATPVLLLTGQSISVQLKIKDRSNMF